jgi:3-dehydroquinate dehydratase
MNLSQLEVPFTCLVVSEPTVRGCLRIVDRFEQAVDSFEVNLPPLDPAGIGDVFQSTSRPCIATNRRSGFMTVYGYFNLPRISEKSRAKALKRAVGLGAAAADFELDMFRPESRVRTRPGTVDGLGRGRRRRRPAELSADPEVVRMQSVLASEIKGAGAEVIMSCHTQNVLRETDALEIVHEVERRGGQFAKIVSLTPRKEDLFEMLECAFSLKRKALIPFTVMNIGVDSTSGRLLSILAGSSWVYCRPRSEHSYRGQPTFDETRGFLNRWGFGNVKSARTSARSPRSTRRPAPESQTD